jgi:predicted Rossmann fold nucleotide-binding protein DprA/Smf involved in DNA uptake
MPESAGADSASVSDRERILHFLGARGGWWPDAISESTGLSISRVLGALLHLELEGRVRRDAGQYHPS